MDGKGGSSSNFKNNQRLSHTICNKTSSVLSKCKQSDSHTSIRGNDSSCSKNETPGHSQTSAHNFSKFHITYVSDTQGRRVTTPDLQSKSIERICKSGTLSAHKHVSSSAVPPSRRLALQNRPEPSILPSEGRGSAPALSSSDIQRGITRNDVLTIRLKHGPKNVLHAHELDSPNSSSRECKNFGLSGRLFNRPPKSYHTPRTRPNDLKCPTNSRMVCQFRKVDNDPSKEHNVPRCLVANLGQPKVVARRKGNYDRNKNPSGPKSKTGDAERYTESRRTVELRQLCSAARPVTSPSLVKIHECLTKTTHKQSCITTSSTNRVKVVDSELPPLNIVTLPPSVAFSHNRCFGSWVGCSARQCPPDRLLVAKRANSPLQSKGDVSHTTCRSTKSTQIESQLSFNTVRQQNGSGSPPEGGGDKVASTDGHNSQIIDITRPASNIICHPLHSGQIQQPCRSPVKTSTSTRVALNTGMPGNDICKMGDSGDRPVCLGEGSRGSQLCNPRPERSQSTVLRRVQCAVELPSSLGIPSPISSAQSSIASEPIDRDISNSSAPVAESILASRPQGESPSGSFCSEELDRQSNRHVNRSATPEHRGSDSRSVEMWGWTEEISDWNDGQISLLKNSWRQSTLKTYKVAWNRWLLWARSKSVNVKKPSGSQLAQFLADLHLIHGFSYNTVLLHKSVVSTLCNADMSSQLSSHVLVKHILKSISLKNPKPVKPPIWDIDFLVQFLSSYSLDKTNIYQTSRHTAILLLLCSGRRIHDLTLLRIDPDHCIRSDDAIIFWPEFGSKTDRDDYRQSGWKLMANNDNVQLNPVFWIENTISLLQSRRDTAGKFNLFVTVRGPAKPASRTVIAGWIKNLFKDANIKFTPGSVRSAVASKNWLNYPVDEVLARGNWRSNNTFQKYYRREVMPNCDSTNTQLVTRLFRPIS